MCIPIVIHIHVCSTKACLFFESDCLESCIVALSFWHLFGPISQVHVSCISIGKKLQSVHLHTYHYIPCTCSYLHTVTMHSQ